VIVLTFSITGGQAQSAAAFSGIKVQAEGFIDYTTSARIYPASRDADPSISSSYNSFSGFLSPGGDVRVVLNRSNIVGLTTQHLTSEQAIYSIYGYNQSGQYVCVPVNDGFSIWLVELNGYFNIPILGERWNIYLGGGPALYFGKRNLQIGNAEANSLWVTAGGIQVSAGVSFRFTDHLGIRSEMKFRSPEFNTTSSFNSPVTTYNGLQVALPKTQYGKVNLDGDDFVLGLFWEF
jgi:opacity protein-like surface antigen